MTNTSFRRRRIVPVKTGFGPKPMGAAGVIAALCLGSALPAQAGDDGGSAYVVLGEQGAAVARVVTAGPACPVLTVDGKRRRMRLRAGPATEPQRPTRSAPALSKPSEFPVSTCELVVGRGVHALRLAGRKLPAPKLRYDRIVVIGDTGCRVKASDNAYQACNDPARYPFAKVAAAAAAWKPDLVVHVGDYLYRENPCPADQPGCAGTVWGYGWDAWRADFFGPGAKLLAAAPWVMVRGNHENCARAGQGWWRFLEPRRLEAGRDCNDPADDARGDADDPYAVPLGGRTQIAVLDLADTTNDAIPATSPLYAQFRDSYRKLDALTGQARDTIVALHHPLLGLRAEKDLTVKPAADGIVSVFEAQNPALLPKGVSAVLAGHVHVWEQISFSSPHPSQFVAGFSGTQEDIVPLPEHLAPGASPAPGAVIDRFSSWVDGFGFMTLQRTGPRTWSVQVHDVDGKVRNRCRIVGRRSSCDLAQVR
ncbi:MAG TPA: metallophosphoesterase [Caulobacteraceae bacterium]|jgi:hypothetical protein|nr:metallophosphoesterase [Caulobacteraceae bacterium]